MSAIIKRHLLGSFSLKGEYVIDPDRSDSAQANGRQEEKKLSPEEEAAIIIERANQTAAVMISKAKQEADSIHTAAYQEGYEAGYCELEAERASFAERLAEIEANIDSKLEDGWAAMEPEVVKLAVEIANKIVHNQISKSDDFVLKTVKSALYQLRERQDLKIRVSPADYDLIREHKDDIMSACDGIRNIEAIEDRRVEQGGCIIETPGGHLDARIETQLHEVERTLMEAAHDGRDQIAA